MTFTSQDSALGARTCLASESESGTLLRDCNGGRDNAKYDQACRHERETHISCVRWTLYAQSGCCVKKSDL
jgi:hypothetical protein